MSAEFKQTGNEVPFSMPEQLDTHQAWKSKGIGYRTKRVFNKEVTTDAYKDSMFMDIRLFSKVTVQVAEIGKTNAIKYSVYASVDPQFGWKAVASDQVVIAGATGFTSFIEAYNFVKIQIASNVAGNAGKVTAFILGKSP